MRSAMIVVRRHFIRFRKDTHTLDDRILAINMKMEARCDKSPGSVS